jgi:ABC-type transport system involved in multi-copper enzyme maturation permease subunit
LKFRIYQALARGVVLESIRRKDLWVVAILGFLIMMTAGVLGFFGIQGLQVFVKDLAVSVLGIFGTIVAVLTASRMIPEEVKQRTLYPLLARPITRFDLLVGKLIGAIAVSWIAFLMLAALTALALASFHVGFEPIMLQYLLCKMLGLAVVCALSLALSLYMTPAAAATMSLIFAFGSGMVVHALTMSYSAASGPAQFAIKALNSVLPQFSLFDLGSRAANLHWAPVPLWVVLFLLGYAVVYSTAMTLLAWTKFRRQAL